MHDHGTHTHAQYKDSDPTDEYGEVEEYGVYVSNRHAAEEVGRLVRKHMVGLENLLYSDRMFFDVWKEVPLGNRPINDPKMPTRMFIEEGQIWHFENECESVAIGRRLELALYGLEVPSHELRWYDPEILADITSAVSWADDRARGVNDPEAWGWSEVQHKLNQCWAFYVTPLLPEGEDSDEGFNQPCPVVLSTSEWDAIDTIESMGEGRLDEWRQADLTPA